MTTNNMGNALSLDNDWEMVAKNQMDYRTKPPIPNIFYHSPYAIIPTGKLQ